MGWWLMKENRVIVPFRITENHCSRPLAVQRGVSMTESRLRDCHASKLTRAHGTDNGVPVEKHTGAALQLFKTT